MWLQDIKIMVPKISLMTMVLLVIVGSPFSVGNHVLGQVPEGEVWEIHDSITPTLEEIEWREEGVFPRSPSWILDGRWFRSTCHQILVKAGRTIFASFGDSFNWTAVNEGFEEDGLHLYPSFEDFKNETLRDPRFWLMYTWGISVDWLGISMNRTKIMFEFDPSTSHATVTCMHACTAEVNGDQMINSFKQCIEIDQKEGEKRTTHIAELGIGCNPAINKAIGYILTDEKLSGSIHVAFGSNQGYGGTSKSCIHWDFVTDPTATIEVIDTKEKIMEDGKIL